MRIRLACSSLLLLAFGVSGHTSDSPTLKESFKRCLNQAVVYTGKEYALDLTTVKVDGKEEVVTAVVCINKEAENLFQSIQNVSLEKTITLTDSSQIVVRFMGEKNPPSSCYQVIKDKTGNEVNQYRCLVAFDLNSKIQEVLNQ